MSDKRWAWTVLLAGVGLGIILTVQQLSPEYRALTQPEYLLERRWAYGAMLLLVSVGAVLLWLVRGRR